MRIFLSADQWDTSPLSLGKEEAHYVLHVLRVQAGDEVDLFDGVGCVGKARVTRVGRHDVDLDILEQVEVAKSLPEIHLAQALPKGKKMDWIIEKATELGVDRVIPMQTRHAVMQAEGHRAEKKVARWQEIARSATRQSGQAWIPMVEPVTPIRDILGRATAQAGPILLCSLGEGARDLKQVLATTRLETGQRLLLLIGPEGDFSLDETQAALDAGATPVSLGSSVLRTETAAIYAVGALRYEFG